MTYAPGPRKTLLVTTLLLCTCCAVGPDFNSPSAPESKNYTAAPLPSKTSGSDSAGGEAQQFLLSHDVPAKWWTLYSSAPLNALVERAITANPNLKAAEASLRQAHEMVIAGQSTFLPSISASGGPERQKMSGASFGQPSLSIPPFTLYNASVNVSYSLDVFGGSRRQLESLHAQADYQQALLEATYISLTANVITTAIQEASLNEQIVQTKAIADVQRHQMEVLQSQFKLGAIPKQPLLAQQALLSQTLATLPMLQKQQTEQHNQLAVLTGSLPEAPLETLDLATLHLPQEIPVSLPSTLVKKRPDIRASEALLHEASAGIGIATANMLPQISLSGSYGSLSMTKGSLFQGGSEVWGLAAGVTQPIFHGGALFHERKAAVASYDSALSLYKSTVLMAFKNVADSLSALQYDADNLVAQETAQQAAELSLDLARKQFQAGAINTLALMDAEHSYAQAQMNLVQARAMRYADTAALFQALGGDWWNRPEIVAMGDTK